MVRFLPIVSKNILLRLADNCMRGNTLKPTEHKPWTLKITEQE